MSQDQPQYPPGPPGSQRPPGALHPATPEYGPPQYEAQPQYQGFPPYPPVPQYPGGPGGPPWQAPAPPPKPPSVARAVQLMYVGAVVSVVALIVGLSQHGSFRTAVINANPNFTSQQVNTAVDGAVAFVVIGGLIGAGLWVWMAWANGRGRNWARITGTVFFGIDTLGLIGDSTKHLPVLSMALGGLVWLIGLSVVILLWRKESSYYFKAPKFGR